MAAERARAEYEAGNSAKAIGLLRAVHDDDPSDVVALRNLVDLLTELGRFRCALDTVAALPGAVREHPTCRAASAATYHGLVCTRRRCPRSVRARRWHARTVGGEVGCDGVPVAR